MPFPNGDRRYSVTSTKPLDTASLPTPPNIPASNASYATIVAKIGMAAKHGAVAVAHVRDTVKGTNTYAKMVRRYADAVIAALGAPAPELVDVVVMSDETAAGLAAELAKPSIKMGTAKPKRARKAPAKAKAA
jgi:hypothetical protein